MGALTIRRTGVHGLKMEDIGIENRACMRISSADHSPPYDKCTQCRSMPINPDHCRSMQISSSQFLMFYWCLDPALIGIDWQWSVLSDILDQSGAGHESNWICCISMNRLVKGCQPYKSLISRTFEKKQTNFLYEACREKIDLFRVQKMDNFRSSNLCKIALIRTTAVNLVSK